MKKSQKGFIAPLLIVVITVLAIGAGIYVYESKKSEVPVAIINDNPEIQPNSQINATSNTVTNPTQNNQEPVFKYNFDLKGTSDYLFSVSVNDKEEYQYGGTKYSGKGIVTIRDVKTKAVFQVINSDDLFFFKDTLEKTSTNDTVLYDELSPVVMGDFNFDGVIDIAVRNGNNGGYGGPSYDIYLFSSINKKFLLSESLTKLASENSGMFFVDKDNKLIITYSKSGCCWHETDKYQVVNSQPTLVYTLVEDATGEAKVKVGGNMVVTEKKLVDGKWIVSTKDVNPKEYYGN